MLSTLYFFGCNSFNSSTNFPRSVLKIFAVFGLSLDIVSFLNNLICCILSSPTKWGECVLYTIWVLNEFLDCVSFDNLR